MNFWRPVGKFIMSAKSKNSRDAVKKVKRLVVKLGSSVIADPDGGLQEKSLRALVRACARLVEDKKIELLLVSSGAIACGMKKLGFKRRPHSIAELQACAASGQASLMQAYEKAFSRHDIMTAQLLVTRGDLEDRRRYINAKHTLNELLKRKVIPIINENDTVAVDEIKVGDNDTLGAFVASLIEADLLLMLTDCDGLHTGDPRHDPEAERISVVRDIDQKTTAMAAGAAWETRVGGMTTKVEAARVAGRYGIATIIADGRDAKVLAKTLAGKDVGTLFLPSEQSLRARKHWIAFTRKSAGQVVLDKGAVEAIVDGSKSLLPSGIKSVKGDFKIGDCVDLVNTKGKVLARGLVAYSASEIEQIKGHKTSEIEKILGYRYTAEVIDRDDLVLT